MKYTSILVAILLGSLLLIPAGLIVTPIKAHEFVVPALSVFPPDTKFFGPCLVSTYFKIDVFLWNNPLSNVDVYAFDFTIDWSSIPAGYVSLVNATAHDPYTSGFVIANNASYTGKVVTDWHLAITNTGLGGLTDANMSVLTLVFHIDQDVCWPNAVLGAFLLTGVKMSSDGTKPVPITDIEIDNGTYEQYSVQPDIELSTTDTAYNATTNTITEKCVSHTFDIEVDLTNVTSVYGFDFVLTYDPLHLETDAQHITFKAAFPPPYETLSVVLGSGTISISLRRPSEKPAVCGAVVPAVDIVFHSIDKVKGENAKGMIPTPSTSSIAITSADIYAKCPDPVTYIPTTSVIPTTYATGWTNPGGPVDGLSWSPVAIVTNDCTNLNVTISVPAFQDGFGGAQVYINGIGYGYDKYTGGYTGVVGTSINTGSGYVATTSFIATPVAGGVTFTIPLAAIAGNLGAPLALTFYWYYIAGHGYGATNDLYALSGATYTVVPTVTIGPPIKYYFKPSPYDLNLDCVVDVQDLMVLLPYYGLSTPAGGYGDLWAPLGSVDIFDFVVIAKHFGPVDP